jgi:5-(carboxyamino)imidazole ribonucleotide synthase
LALEKEVAVLCARRPNGQLATYPVIETVQHDGILVELVMPARIDAATSAKAVALAHQIIDTVGAIGTIAVELFITSDGDVVLNELALRPHNSGHATLEATVTSQFHNHLRAVLDWPLGATDMLAPAAATVNLIGGSDPTRLTETLPAALGDPLVHVHWYNKGWRPGRKLGHVTVLGDTADDALRRARAAAKTLMGA